MAIFLKHKIPAVPQKENIELVIARDIKLGLETTNYKTTN